MATLLSTTGYGSTGSSAATNILEEFEGIKSLSNEEFTFAHESDGIADIEDSFREGHRLKTDLAVKRFLALSHQLASSDQYKKHFNEKFGIFADEYINTIIKCEWDGWWHRAFEMKKISTSERFKFYLAEHLFKWRLQSLHYDLYEPDKWFPNYRPVIETYYGNILNKNDEDDFLKKTRVFTDKLLREEDLENNFKYILLDQAIPPILPSKYSRYFTNPKIIIVDRDPRDLYVLNKALWGVGYIPSLTVEQFIDWYTATRGIHENEVRDADTLLFLHFESLIYEYDISLNKVYDFIDIPEKHHVNKLKYFNPDISKQNTQVFLQYPDLFPDINKIEKYLGKYCYAFPKEGRDDIHRKYFLIQTINNEVEEVQRKGMLPSGYRKYTPYILYRSTCFYKSFSFFIREIKKRKGLSLIKLLIKSSIKIAFSLFFLPINFFINLFLYIVFSNKSE
jgi:hypothetical protein